MDDEEYVLTDCARALFNAESDLAIALENQRKLSAEKGAALRERDEAREMLKDLEARIRACIERMRTI